MKTAKTAAKQTAKTPDTISKLDQAVALKPLTTKQKAFADALINNKKMSATQAVKSAYNTTTDLAARSIASENLTKPNIISYLADHSDLTEQVITNTIKEYQLSDDIKQRSLAVDSAKWVHDKIHGKAKQQIDVRSQAITLNIDLTGDGIPNVEQ